MDAAAGTVRGLGVMWMSTDGEKPRQEPSGGRPTNHGEVPAPEPVDIPAEPPEPAPYSEPTAEPTAEDEESAEPRRTGRIREQDPETTVPREPTLAERRARQQAARREREAEAARLAEEERRRKIRKRVLVGGGVTVGVVALIAIGYSASQPDEVQARCVDDNNVVVDDNNCVQPAAASSNGSYQGGGFVPFPIFIGGGGRQYHYTYGGAGNVGQVATGGTTAAPRNATVTTQSGRTIQRGGFGVSRSGGGGAYGKSGGSGGS
jgi:hypothetical protein